MSQQNDIVAVTKKARRSQEEIAARWVKRLKVEVQRAFCGVGLRPTQRTSVVHEAKAFSEMRH